MRAIPSPQDSTRPVSRTSTSRPYSLIWRLMTSLISAGRISMVSSNLLEGRCARELFGEPLQLSPYAAVVHFTLDLDEHAAQQLRLQHHRGQHVLSGQAGERRHDLFLLGRRQR